MKPSLSSEAYRQALVRDGQRRFAEWQRRYQRHCQQYRQEISRPAQHPAASSQTAQDNLSWMDSETYRRALVQDGQRRFEEWHQSFLAYQNRFLSEMKSSEIKS
jgi:ABC-type iron transport system FetAB ATPase subunit